MVKSPWGDPTQHRYLTVDFTIKLQEVGFVNLDSKIYVRCSMVDDNHSVLQRVGNTEPLKNTQCLSFHRHMQHDYLFQKSQRLCFTIHEESSKSKCQKEIYSQEEFVEWHADHKGIVYIDCADVIQAGENGIIRPMECNPAKIVITGKILNPLHSFKINFSAKGHDFDKKQFPETTNAYYQLFSKTFKIATSEVVPNSQKPGWKEQTFSGDFLDQYCHELVVKVFDRKDLEDPDFDELIGEAIIPIGELTHNFNPAAKHKIVHPKKKYKKKRPHSGQIIIEDFTMIKQPEFFGLLQQGLEFKFHCAVDFTSSNGKWNDKGSHHYNNPELKSEKRTKYSDCIQAVGNIINAYNYDKEIHATGFGARLDGAIEGSDHFPLNRKTDEAACHGMDQVLDSYFACRQQVEFGSYTNCFTTINRAKEIAGKTRHLAIYHVLLILVDSDITDMLKVLAELKKCEDEPISVVVIGIGADPFAQMHKLTEESAGNKIVKFMQKRKRRLIQFSKYNDLAFQFSNKNNEKADHKISTHISEMLAGDMLKSLPKQVEEYFLLMGLSSYNIQRRLSPETPPLFVDPGCVQIVRGPLSANAQYGQVVRSFYAIGRATGKELIPIDVLLAGFSNPTMEGHDHYQTVKQTMTAPRVEATAEEGAVYDDKIKAVFDPNYVENLYEMQEHRKNVKDKLNKGGNVRSATMKNVMDYVENPFDKRHKEHQGPKINVKIEKQTVIIDPNTQTVYAQGPKLASRVEKADLPIEQSDYQRQSPPCTPEPPRDQLKSESKDSGMGSLTVSPASPPRKLKAYKDTELKEDDLLFSDMPEEKSITINHNHSDTCMKEESPKSVKVTRVVEADPDSSQKLPNPNIKVNYEQSITVAPVMPGSVPLAPSDSLAAKFSPKSRRKGISEIDELNGRGNSSANPFSQLSKKLDAEKGLTQFSEIVEDDERRLGHASRRGSNVSIQSDSSEGSWYDPRADTRTLYIPVPRAACNNSGQYMDLDYSAVKFEDFF